MQTCSRCYHQNPDTVLECELCGSPLGTARESESPGAAPSVAAVLAALTRDMGESAQSPTLIGAAAASRELVERSDESTAGFRLVLDGEGEGRTGSASSLTSMEQGYVHCPRCAAVNDVDASHCTQCGTSLAARVAPERGKAIDADITLVAINEDGSDGARIPLEHEASTVGRAGDISYPGDVFLSPRHAALILASDELYVEDLNSLNGTYLKLRDEVRLNPGDTFLMGRQVLRVQRFEQDTVVRSRAADGTRYMGSPPPGSRFKLEQVGVGGVVQDVYCLPPDGASIGREKGDIVFPRDKFMSSRHARIHLADDGEYYLSDLNSSNGTWVKTWDRRRLQDGDFLFLGQQLFRVEFGA